MAGNPPSESSGSYCRQAHHPPVSSLSAAALDSSFLSFFTESGKYRCTEPAAAQPTQWTSRAVKTPVLIHFIHRIWHCRLPAPPKVTTTTMGKGFWIHSKHRKQPGPRDQRPSGQSSPELLQKAAGTVGPGVSEARGGFEGPMAKRLFL